VDGPPERLPVNVGGWLAPIFLADVHLTRARLFRDRTELTKAHELLLDLRARGYHRHDEMLADTEATAEHWPVSES
jgi:hypothetical protein